jgi:hypothetical protein
MVWAAFSVVLRDVTTIQCICGHVVLRRAKSVPDRRPAVTARPARSLDLKEDRLRKLVGRPTRQDRRWRNGDFFFDLAR